MQNTFSNALSKAVSQHIELSPTKAPNAGVAGVADHAAWHDLPVAAGGVCGDAGANRFGAAAALPLLSACQAGWSDDGAGGGGSAGA